MKKVALIIPSINPDRYAGLFADMQKSCTKYSFEMIGIGPVPPPQEVLNLENFKFIKDFGSPARCLQIASLIVEAEYIAWCPDDVKMTEELFDSSIKLFDEFLQEKDGMNLLYSEGENFAGVQHEDKTYWIAHTHPDLRLAGVNSEWRIAPLFMYKKTTFDKYGGLDCRFEHINLNTHDLAFAVQANGGKIVDSPSKVFAVNWNPNPYRPEYVPVFTAYHTNDAPLFRSLYNNANYVNERNISLDNWKQQPTVWKRRFK
jgi:hypothetical protein